MNPSLVLQFWLVAVTLAMTPGPDWAYAISAGLRAKSVVPAVAGIISGYAIVIGVIVAGVGALIARYPAVLTTMTYAGAGYLIYLGASTLSSARSKAIGESSSAIAAPLTATPTPTIHTPTARVSADSSRVQFLRGMGTSGINPKGMLLLLAILPQFTTTTGWPLPAQMLTLGALHLANCVVIYSLVALGSQRALRTHPKASLIMMRVSGIAMTVIGLSIVIENLM
jgi:threonine/homoserine/homoserine lactone efflux protein